MICKMLPVHKLHKVHHFLHNTITGEDTIADSLNTILYIEMPDGETAAVTSNNEGAIVQLPEGASSMKVNVYAYTKYTDMKADGCNVEVVSPKKQVELKPGEEAETQPFTLNIAPNFSIV